jgi:hypothetical protein
MTFSNPQYALQQTAPYEDTSKGKNVRTAIVAGAAPVEDESVLDVPTEYETP